jgi:hypothetical protein
MPRLPRYTVKDIINLHPCYKENYIIKQFDGQKDLSLLDIMRLNVGAHDVLWLVWQLGLPKELLRVICKEVVESTTKFKKRGWETTPDSWKKVWACGCGDLVINDSDHAQATRDYLYALLIAEGYK